MVYRLYCNSLRWGMRDGGYRRQAGNSRTNSDVLIRGPWLVHLLLYLKSKGQCSYKIVIPTFHMHRYGSSLIVVFRISFLLFLGINIFYGTTQTHLLVKWMLRNKTFTKQNLFFSWAMCFDILSSSSPFLKKHSLLQ